MKNYNVVLIANSYAPKSERYVATLDVVSELPWGACGYHYSENRPLRFDRTLHYGRGVSCNPKVDADPFAALIVCADEVPRSYQDIPAIGYFKEGEDRIIPKAFVCDDPTIPPEFELTQGRDIILPADQVHDGRLAAWLGDAALLASQFKISF